MWREKHNLENRVIALEQQMRVASELLNKMSKDMTVHNIWYPPARDPLQNMMRDPVRSVGKVVDAILSHLGLVARVDPPIKTDERIELRPAPSDQMK